MKALPISVVSRLCQSHFTSGALCDTWEKYSNGASTCMYIMISASLLLDPSGLRRH